MSTGALLPEGSFSASASKRRTSKTAWSLNRCFPKAKIVWRA